MQVFKSFISSWWVGREGVAATEAAFVFPILLTLLLGVFDFGNAILVLSETVFESNTSLVLLSETVF